MTKTTIVLFVTFLCLTHAGCTNRAKSVKEMMANKLQKNADIQFETGYEINIVPNPGFEEGEKGWQLHGTKWQIDRTTSRSGFASLKYQDHATNPPESNQSNAYTEIMTAIPVQTGRTYRLSGWIKTKDLKIHSKTEANGAVRSSQVSLSVACQDFPGGYLGRTLVSESPQWQYFETVIPAVVPSGSNPSVNLFLGVGGGWDGPISTGTVWFDDISLVEIAKFDPILKTPAYRGYLYPGMSRKVLIRSEGILDTPLYPFWEMQIDLAVKDSGGKVVARVIKDQSHANLTAKKWDSEWEDTEFNLDALAPGSYTITCRLLYKSLNLVLKTKNLSLTVFATNERPKVYLDEYGRAIVDGKPFFPLGFYTDGSFAVTSNRDDFKIITDARFNTIMQYGITEKDPATLDAFLKIAQEKNVKVLFDLNGNKFTPLWGSPTDPSSQETALAMFKNYFSKYNDVSKYPSILGWYLNDENTFSFDPAMNYMPQILHHYKILKENDQQHPVWQVLAYGQNASLHNIDSADVIGLDHYPTSRETNILSEPAFGTGQYLFEFGQATAYIKQETRNTLPIWMVPESASMRKWGTRYLSPTGPQILNQSYQALIQGSRGLIFFTYYLANTYPGYDGLPYNPPGYWEQEIAPIGPQLSALAPVVLGIDAPSGKSVTVSDSRIGVLTRVTENGEIYCLAVNPYNNETINVTFKIGTDLTVPHVAVGLPGATPTRNIQTTQGVFSDQLEHLAIRVYRLK